MRHLLALIALVTTPLLVAHAWADDAKPWLSPGTRVGQEVKGPDGGALMWVPSGKSMMGATPDDLRYSRGRLDGRDTDDAGPVHRVRISKGFWLGKCEVTNDQYRAYCEATKTDFPAESKQPGDHPVVRVTWEEAIAYCHHYGLVLPSEAQWEYAARGAENRWFPWGNFWDSKRACYSHRKGPGGTTFPVTAFPEGASWCGTLNMAGNVIEFCNDWYDKLYYGVSPVDDPEGPDSGEYRVGRGGGYGNPPPLLRSACRITCYPDHRAGDFGFRVCITP